MHLLNVVIWHMIPNFGWYFDVFYFDYCMLLAYAIVNRLPPLCIYVFASIHHHCLTRERLRFYFWMTIRVHTRHRDFDCQILNFTIYIPKRLRLSKILHPYISCSRINEANLLIVLCVRLRSRFECGLGSLLVCYENSNEVLSRAERLSPPSRYSNNPIMFYRILLNQIRSEHITWVSKVILLFTRSFLAAFRTRRVEKLQRLHCIAV